MSKKYLITGGAGFIGSHLAEYLLAAGHQVRIIDDVSTGSLDNLRHLAHHGDLEVKVGNVCDYSLVREAMQDVHGVFHLAASVGVKHIMDHLVASIANNIEGTAAVLGVAADLKVPVLLTPTSEVYGKSIDKPSREDDDLRMGETIKSRWSYACSKALDEYLAFAFWHERQLPVVVVRLFNTVGERQSDAYGMVLPTFVRQALANQPITIHGDGEQSRCFCHVLDVVPALHQLLEHPAAKGEVFNIGSTESVTISELADRVITLTNSRSQKVLIPYREAYKSGFDDIRRRVPDIAKITSLIGFKPTRSLDDIIRASIAYERTQVAVV